MTEPDWLSVDDVIFLHDRQLARFGGPSGIRDKGALESAVNRPKHRESYGESDVFALAASLAFGLARNHAFVDGNKRVAALACATFLALDGVRLTVSDSELARVFYALAAGDLTEEALKDALTRWAEI
jgi:death-on-curing protein